MTMTTHYFSNEDFRNGYLGTDDCLRTKAAKIALTHVLANLKTDSIIGIGTGATVEVFVELLASSRATFAACVSSSDRSTKAITKHQLPLIEMKECSQVDFYIDGIDEGLENGTTIKGGGAALAREKVLATLAKTFITIADSGRKVQELGQFPLPIEILPSAQLAATLAFRQLGGEVTLRAGCVTDNGNIILDVTGLDMTEPERLEIELNAVPGVVENGIFASRKADLMLFSEQSGVTLFSRNESLVTELSITLSGQGQ
ncbi:ribose-5-phosphate isomerase RpiA [Vibrio tapetis subsp. quintayensis]|nr:ribose-5-phosphate isomerase RpiA [Vibrio tapetis]MDN3681143.1 ribose-5-phosphate isomerase RpiA [Vibrio tapetis subsp. quintayensis]